MLAESANFNYFDSTKGIKEEYGTPILKSRNTSMSNSYESSELKVPNSSKYLLNGGELKVDLRTESGLMTGRRTLFFLEANWPAEILQQKETQDMKIFYYPGTKNVDWQPDDPTKLWLTEEFFPGTNVYLEVQCWSQNGDKMQFISKCNKHENIIKVANASNYKNKDVSDSTVNWKGSSLPKIAICFCCTPSCFKKLDPFLFIRMRFGQVVYQSQWFQLVFRKSTKRRRDSFNTDKAEDLPPQKVNRGEEIAIAELSNIAATLPLCRSPSSTSDKFISKSSSFHMEVHSPASSPQSPFGSFPIGSPIMSSLAPLSSLCSSRRNSMNSPQPSRASDISQLLCGDLDIARSLLKLEDNAVQRPARSNLDKRWGELENMIMEIRQPYQDGSKLCIDVIRSITVNVNDYDTAKETFLRWLNHDRNMTLKETLGLVLPLFQESWFHGQPNASDFERRLLSHNAMKVPLNIRLFAVRMSIDNAYLLLNVVNEDNKTISCDAIKLDNVDGHIGFRFLDQLNSAPVKSLHELIKKSSRIDSTCSAFSRN